MNKGIFSKTASVLFINEVTKISFFVSFSDALFTIFCNVPGVLIPITFLTSNWSPPLK